MAVSQKEADLQMMLAAGVHLGTKNVNYQVCDKLVISMAIGWTCDSRRTAARCSWEHHASLSPPHSFRHISREI